MLFKEQNDGNSRIVNGRRIASLILLAGVMLITGCVMLIIEHRDSMNNALDTGQCLVNKGASDFLESIRHLLHRAYRWIFKACG